MENNTSVSNSVTSTIDKIEDLDMLTDVITNFITFDIGKKIEYRIRILLKNVFYCGIIKFIRTYACIYLTTLDSHIIAAADMNAHALFIT